jgi:regulator of sigma E protease
MTLIAGFILLGVLIFFHELGHFVVAKLCGVRVLTFSLGFGPRLFGVTVGDTDYRISALPLGGYVRMYGDDLHEEVPDEEKHRAFLHRPIPQKAAIAVAGPAANFLLPIVLFFGAALGTETVPQAVVGTVLSGEAAERAGLVRGDKVISANGAPIGDFYELLDVIKSHPGQEVDLVVLREGTEKRLTVIPRAVRSNHPLKQDEMHGQIGMMPTVVLPHIDVLPGSPADQAGLRASDEVLKVNGEAIDGGEALLARLDALKEQPWSLEVRRRTPATDGEPKAPETLTFELAVPTAALAPVVEGQLRRYAVNTDEIDEKLERTLAQTRSVLDARAGAIVARRGLGLAEGTLMVIQDKTTAKELGLQKGDRLLAVDGAALQFADDLSRRMGHHDDAPHVIGVRRGDHFEVMLFRQGRSPERGLEDFRVFGALVGHAYGNAPTLERNVGVVEALERSVAKTWDLVSMTAKGLWMLVTFQVSFKSLGGPITIFSLAGDAMDAGLERFLYLMCFISVNLGIINLLPVPVLDGGHLLLFAIEAVRREDLDIATKERALKVGFTMLLVLMVAAIFNDLMRLIS